MERRTYVWSLIAGALGGAATGVLLTLAHHKWGDKLRVRRQAQKTKTVVRRRVSARQATQLGVLGFQLLREVAKLLQPEESA